MSNGTRPRRRGLRAIGVVALAAVGLALASTGANLALEAAERSSIAPYGEKVQVRGGSLNVFRTGTAGPTIVLLSGYGTAAPALDFAPLIRALGGYRVIVVEGFGYGYSDMSAGPRTVENISAELHEALSKLVDEPYILAGHSIAGFYTLYYANRYPHEVSAVIGIDPTVPAAMAEAPGAREPGGLDPERVLSATGLVRWATSIAPGLAEPAGDAFTASERGRIRLMTSWNFANPASIDEGTEMAGNAWKLQGVTYPDRLPVLDFLSQDSIDSMPGWLPAHERQLRNVTRHEIVVLEGGHYLHWTQSAAMAKKINAFLAQGE